MILAGWIARVTVLLSCCFPLAAQTSLADQAAAAENAGDYNRAIALLGQAIHLAPRDPSLHIARGVAFFHETYFADSIREFRAALTLQPLDSDALSNLAFAWMQIGDVQDACPALEKAIATQSDDHQLREALGTCYLQTSQWHKAADQYGVLLQSDPNNAVLLYGLAVARKHLEDPAAQPLLRKALQVQPDFPAAQFELAEALWQEGQLEEAEKYLEDLVKAHPDFLAAYFPLVEVLRQLGRLSEALDTVNRVMQADAGSASAYQQLAVLEKSLGHQDAAATAFHHAEELRNQLKLHQAAHIAMESGIRLLQIAKPDAAIQKLRFAIKLYPSDSEAHYWLAMALEGQGAESTAEFKKAYAINPHLKPPF